MNAKSLAHVFFSDVLGSDVNDATDSDDEVEVDSEDDSDSNIDNSIHSSSTDDRQPPFNDAPEFTTAQAPRPAVGGKIRQLVRDRSKDRRRKTKKEQPENIAKFLYENGGCCKGVKTSCATLKAFPRAEIIQNRKLVLSDRFASKLHDQPAVFFTISHNVTRRVVDGKEKIIGGYVGGKHLCQKAFCEMYNISR